METPTNSNAIVVGEAPDASPLQESRNNGLAAKQNESPQAIGADPSVPGLAVATDHRVDHTKVSTPNGNDPGEKMLSSSDLVKLFEIALAEIRSSQTLVFSALGFAVTCGIIILKIHDPAIHNGKFDFVCWFIGFLICAVSAVLIGRKSSHHEPLEDFIEAAGSGKSERVLNRLIGALHKANKSVRETHQLKTPMAIGVLFVVLALLCDAYMCH